MIDSTLFGADIPAGTYAAGDVVELGVIAGPSAVRSGRGTPILKQIITGMLGTVSGSISSWRIFVQNSDWVDSMCNHPGWMTDTIAFAEESSNVQNGCDCVLTPNSGWRVWAECLSAVTTTVDNSLFALVDIDYPQNGGVIEPDKVQGFPTSIQYDKGSTTLYGLGKIKNAKWDVENVDSFKAGYKYTLQKATITSLGGSGFGFLALSNAAGMAGLTRIIPVTGLTTSIRAKIRYASVLSKGPMDVKTMLFNNTASDVTASGLLINADWVKKKI